MAKANAAYQAGNEKKMGTATKVIISLIVVIILLASGTGIFLLLKRR